MKKKTEELEAEIESLKMLNQALTDELDAIYEGQAEVNAIFDDFLNTPDARVLH